VQEHGKSIFQLKLVLTALMVSPEITMLLMSFSPKAPRENTKAKTAIISSLYSKKGLD
jgi:hypothetical protein